MLGRPIRRFYLAHFCLEVQFWFPVWYVFLRDSGFSVAAIAAADALFRLVVVAAELPAGRLADRFGVVRAYRWAALGTVVVFAAIPAAGGPAILLVVWAMWGLLWALNSGVATAVVFALTAGSDAGERQRAFGTRHVVSGTAIVASNAVAGAVYRIDPVIPWLMTAGLGLVAYAALRTIPRPEPRPPVDDDRTAWWHQIGAVPGLRALVGLAAFVLCFGWSVRILYQPTFEAVDLAVGLYGLAYAGYALGGIVGAWAAGRAGSDHFTAAVSTLVGVLVASVAVSALWPEVTPWVAMPAAGAAVMAVQTFLDHRLTAMSPSRLSATVLSVVAVIGGLVILVARPALVVVADSVGVSAAYAGWATLGGVTGAALVWKARRSAAI